MIQTLVRSAVVIACIAVGAVAVQFGIGAVFDPDKKKTPPPTQQELLESEFSQEGEPPRSEG